MQSRSGRENPVKKALATCRSAFFSTGLLSCAINLLMLTGPLFMLQIYDRVLTSRSIPTLVALAVLTGVLFCFYGLFGHDPCPYPRTDCPACRPPARVRFFRQGFVGFQQAGSAAGWHSASERSGEDSEIHCRPRPRCILRYALDTCVHCCDLSDAPNPRHAGALGDLYPFRVGRLQRSQHAPAIAYG